MRNSCKCPRLNFGKSNSIPGSILKFPKFSRAQVAAFEPTLAVILRDSFIRSTTADTPSGRQNKYQ